MRILAIDFGEQRVGLAISDAGRTLATPLEVVDAASAPGRIGDIARAEGVTELLVGLPINMDGSTGGAALRVSQWAEELSRTTGIPVRFVDERLSSFQAEQTLRDRKLAGEKLTRKKKKGRLDALAAASFLQAFLDGDLPLITAAPKKT